MRYGTKMAWRQLDRLKTNFNPGNESMSQESYSNRRIRIGELVKLKDIGSYYLHEGDDKCWNERKGLIPSNKLFCCDDVGLVLMKKKISPDWPKSKSYIKLLTPCGIGWVFETYLRPV